MAKKTLSHNERCGNHEAETGLGAFPEVSTRRRGRDARENMLSKQEKDKEARQEGSHCTGRGGELTGGLQSLHDRGVPTGVRGSGGSANLRKIWM